MNKEYSKLLKENNCSRLGLIINSIKLTLDTMFNGSLNDSDSAELIKSKEDEKVYLMKVCRSKSNKEYIVYTTYACILLLGYMRKKAKQERVNKNKEAQEIKDKWKGII